MTTNTRASNARHCDVIRVYKSACLARLLICGLRDLWSTTAASDHRVRVKLMEEKLEIVDLEETSSERGESPPVMASTSTQTEEALSAVGSAAQDEEEERREDAQQDTAPAGGPEDLDCSGPSTSSQSSSDSRDKLIAALCDKLAEFQKEREQEERTESNQQNELTTVVQPCDQLYGSGDAVQPRGRIPAPPPSPEDVQENDSSQEELPDVQRSIPSTSSSEAPAPSPPWSSADEEESLEEDSTGSYEDEEESLEEDSTGSHEDEEESLEETGTKCHEEEHQDTSGEDGTDVDVADVGCSPFCSALKSRAQGLMTPLRRASASLRGCVRKFFRTSVAPASSSSEQEEGPAAAPPTGGRDEQRRGQDTCSLFHRWRVSFRNLRRRNRVAPAAVSAEA